MSNERTLPSDVPSEQGILGCVLLDPEFALPLLRREGIGPRHFYDGRHGQILTVAGDMHRRGIPLDDVLMLPRLEGVDAPYLNALRDATPNALNLEYFFPQFLESFHKRQLIKYATRAIQLAHDPKQELAVIRDTFEQFNKQVRLNGEEGVRAKSLFDLEFHPDSDPGELIKDRFLCRGGGALLVAPTGVGKSVLAMQLMMSFALGRECFGIRPARPLTSLLIQAENDEGDLAEMREGVAHGLNLTPTQIERLRESVKVYTEDQKCGVAFVDRVDELLGVQKPDLIWIDPALSYLGGEVTSQKDVGGFLRNLLNPVIHRHGCGCFLIHHTNKPSQGKEKSDWQAGDFAYLGSGSAEWANWARAVLAVRSVGSHDVYELRAGKRGARLGWVDSEGKKAYSKLIGHSTDDNIYWRDASEDELKPEGRPKSYNAEELLSTLPPEGLMPSEWQRTAKEECGISESSFHRERRALEKAGRIHKSKITNKWQPIQK